MPDIQSLKKDVNTLPKATGDSREIQRCRDTLDAAREVAGEKEVVLDKLGKTRRLLGMVKALGEAVSDVSACKFR